MRVAILGVGGVGRTLASELRADERVDALLLADAVPERAKVLAGMKGRVHLEARQLDASDPAAVARTIRKWDLVVNATLPKHNLAIMRAALDAGVSYLDIAGTGPAVPGGTPGILEQLELHDRFRDAGLRALLSMGLDPGFTNVLARDAADKLDTICGCFGVGLIPTGAADPYALRRQALGIIFIIMDKSDKKTRFNLESFIDKSLECLEGKLSRDKAAVKNEVVEFFKERLRNQLLLQNISHDSIEAILSTNWFDVFDAAERVSALEKFKKHPACKSLVIASKRVSNILKGIQLKGEPDETLFTDENEKALWKVSKAIEPGIKKHRENGDYEKAFTSLASIKDVIDKFFDKVMVMVDDEKTRENRLMLLAFVSRLYAGMADLSKLVAQE